MVPVWYYRFKKIKLLRKGHVGKVAIAGAIVHSGKMGVNYLAFWQNK